MFYPVVTPLFYDILINSIFLNRIKDKNMENIGRLINKWTIISLEGKDKKSNKLYKCRCICGSEKIRQLYDIYRINECRKCSDSKRDIMPNLVGNKFGKWAVISKVENKKGNTRYLCKCECGSEKIIFAYHLRNGNANCCAHCRVKTHGMSYTSTFRIWAGMIARCTNSNLKAFKYYGGRGIKVCERWLKFENFYKDMGDRPKNLQIDRINNDGNYEPGNCRWVTSKVNNSNKNIIIKKLNKELQV